MAINLGETLTFSWRPGYTVTVDQRLLDALAKARAALIAVACTGGTITYTGLERCLEDSKYSHRNFWGLLDAISLDCERRGEPSLAVLVTRKGVGNVGSGFINNSGLSDEDLRHAVQQHWRTTL